MILVCGEALFDMFAAETAGGFAFDARAAGSPFNVAVGLSRLGAPSALCTGLSTDFLGDKLAARLAEEGVSLSAIQRLNAPTTAAYVTLADDGSASYAFYGDGAADRSLRADSVVDLTGVTMLHFGSFSFVTGSSADLYLSLMQRAAGRFVSYDPNVRPTVEADMQVWRDRLKAAIPYCTFVKLSDEDADRLFPGAAPDDVAERLLTAGVKIAAITAGGDGATLYTRDHRLFAPGVAVDVEDTVGAGDSFQAAFLAKVQGAISAGGGSERWMRPGFLGDALTYAVKAAAMTCSRPGADPPAAADLAPA